VAGGAGLSGFEFMQALTDGRAAQAPIALLLNMRPRHVEPGLAVFECRPDESVHNPIGAVHGGQRVAPDCTDGDPGR
jgi:acyl-coenzyme A thioesterase PaaI-like protein